MRHVVAIFMVLLCLSTCGAFAKEMNSVQSRKALEKVLTDYIALYRGDSLDQWKLLFHPSVSVFFPAEDGTINYKSLEEFLARQKNFFAKKKSVSERLENVQIFEGKQIARVTADFIFIDEGTEKPGKLGMHLVEAKDGWKIVSLVFSYNQR